jgi:hypothetical protein
MGRPISQTTRTIIAALPGTAHDIAARTGIPYANVTVSLSRARQRGEVVASKPEGSRTITWARAPEDAVPNA